MRSTTTGPLLTLLALTVVGCTDRSEPTGVSPDNLQNAQAVVDVRPSVRAGGVYLMTNATAANEVLVFRRTADGSLTPGGAVSTGGTGTGSGLGNQGALALTHDGRILLVVNAASDDVSSLRVTPEGLELVDRVPSGGDTPISVTVRGSLVYVLNGGTPNSITALRLAPSGALEPIAGSSRPLSDDAVAPAQIGFAPSGRVLVVTEKATNLITTFTVAPDGTASGPSSFPSAAATPFGFAFDGNGDLIVSEAVGGAPDASTVSSYAVGLDGGVTVIDGAVPTTETAACWIAISGNSRFAYSTNAGSGTISGVSIAHDGNLTLLDGDGVTGDSGPGSTPLDAAFSQGGRYLYVLAAGVPGIAVFGAGSDGGLTPLPGTPLPAGTNGMAAW